jgi:CBS domain-containing protein
MHDLGTSHVGTFPVVGPVGEPTGVVTLRQIRRLPRDRWPTTRLDGIATPASRMTVAHPDDRLVDVLAGATSGDGRIVVTDVDGRLIGLVTPSDVASAFERLSLVRSTNR